ncbi:hypothetical protein PQI07_23300 [Methylobacterium sp. 092160098-2]|uniref:hypothetical protein n=1 Tax=Methylobacterium sp. 092160098-2 TaxID=3025129 RepID=UPI002381A254|nr:hypothetical protein [Methylobacterium sp. 092160098-2]MDE4913609.1 hypothetical protein [Methylobacterium sp. 092160098-2]
MALTAGRKPTRFHLVQDRAGDARVEPCQDRGCRLAVHGGQLLRRCLGPHPGVDRRDALVRLGEEGLPALQPFLVLGTLGLELADPVLDILGQRGERLLLPSEAGIGGGVRDAGAVLRGTGLLSLARLARLLLGGRLRCRQRDG